jgi:hypothetical protein
VLDRVLTLAHWRRGTSNRVSSRRALLATSALAGLSLCLLSSQASAAQVGADACSAALAGKSRAAIEQFLKEYPADGLACLATATTSTVGGNPRGGNGSNGVGGPGGSGPGGSNGNGHGGSSGHGSSSPGNGNSAATGGSGSSAGNGNGSGGTGGTGGAGVSGAGILPICDI